MQSWQETKGGTPIFPGGMQALQAVTAFQPVELDNQVLIEDFPVECLFAIVFDALGSPGIKI